MVTAKYHLQRRTAIFTQDILVTKAKRERSTIHHKIESAHEITNSPVALEEALLY